jgi:hypothetical protein
MTQKGKGIFLVYVDIDAQHEKEFNDWYNTEHLPELPVLPTGVLDFSSRFRYITSHSPICPSPVDT